MENTKKINKNIILSLIFKGITILVAIISVPIFLEIFSKNEYGLWLTIFTMLTWLAMCDFGLSQGLRNQVVEAISTSNSRSISSELTVSYLIIGIVVCIFILIALVISKFVGFENVLNISLKEFPNINSLMLTVVILFSIQIILNNVNGVLHALQRTYSILLMESVFSILSLVILIFCRFYNIKSLITIASCILSTRIIITLLFTLSAYKSLKKQFKLKFNFNLNILERITFLKQSFKHFVIQFSAVTLLQSVNFLITRFYGPSDVVPFSICSKIYTNLVLVYYLIISPYWSGFTYAYFENDFQWIKKSFSRMIIKFSLFILVVFFITYTFNKLIEIWIGNKVIIPNELKFAFMVYTILTMWNSTFSHFLNGINQINIQFKIAIIHIILNIPLCIFCIEVFDMRSVGILWIICGNILLLSILLPYQSFKLLKTMNPNLNSV